MNFSVDPPSLRSDGRRIESIRARADGDLGRMHDETTSHGPAPWGSGLGGSGLGGSGLGGAGLPVAAAYDELTAVTGDLLGLIGAALATSGAGATQMADAYEHADDTARDRFHRVDGRVPGSPP